MNRALTIFIILFLLSKFVFAESRNLILITIDTLRADYLSYNGSKKVKTPNLDALAAQGVNFQRARSAVPLTLPSHASILTGLYPPAHGVRDNAAFRLSEDMLTITEVLKKRGYRTAAFIGSFVLDHRFGLAQGFDFYDDRTWSDADMLERFEAERNAETVYNAAVQWLRANAGKQPLFIWIHLYDPHAPYTAPESFRNRYPRDPYAAEVAYTDFVVGKLHKEFGSLKLLNESMIAMTGDHGEGLGEHQESTHSVLIYNSTLHVPMLIVAPGWITPGTRVNQLCRTIDLAPTLLDYLGVQKSLGQGVSLRNLIEGKPQKELTAYSESLYPRLNLGWSELIGLEGSHHHYIQAPKAELYEIQKDPLEKSNRIAEFPDVVRQYRQNLQEYFSTKTDPSRPPESMDAETREKLASLGYVSTTSPLKGTPSIDPKDKIGVWNEIQVALYHMSQKDHASAVQKLKSILSKERSMPLLYDYLGATYMQLQDWSNAEQIYRLALKSGMESSMFRTNLGLIHFHRKQFSQAEQELQKAIRLDATNVSAHYHLGNVFRSRGELQKALEQYESALKINPDYVFALNGSGMAYAALKQDNRSLEAFQQAIKIDPANAAAYFNLAVQLERMKQPKSAMEAYKTFLSVSNEKDFAAQRLKASEAIQRLQ